MLDAFEPVANHHPLSQAVQLASSLFVIAVPKSIYWVLSLLDAVQTLMRMSLFVSPESFSIVNPSKYHFKKGADEIVPTWVTRSFHIVNVNGSPSFTTSFQAAYHTNTDQSTVNDIANWIRIFLRPFIDIFN